MFKAGGHSSMKVGDDNLPFLLPKGKLWFRKIRSLLDWSTGSGAGRDLDIIFIELNPH